MRILLFLLILTAISCSKETSIEEPPPIVEGPFHVQCVYFKLLKVQVGFNGDYAYNADLFDQHDTTRELKQFNTRFMDSDYWKSVDHTVLCNYVVVDKTSTILPQ